MNGLELPVQVHASLATSKLLSEEQWNHALPKDSMVQPLIVAIAAEIPCDVPAKAINAEVSSLPS